MNMFKTSLCISVAALAFLPGISNAKGCLKGAAVGGIGGHVAGHHGLIGAAAGCAIGHHLANKKDASRIAPEPAQPAPAPAPAKSPPPAGTAS